MINGIHPSIHPFMFCSSSLSRCPRPPSHHQHFSAPPGQPRGATLGQLENVIPSACPEPRGRRPAGRAKDTLKGRRPGSASVGPVLCLHYRRGHLRPSVHLLLCHSVTHEQDPQVLELPGLGQFRKGANGPSQIDHDIPVVLPTEPPRALGCKPSPDP